MEFLDIKNEYDEAIKSIWSNEKYASHPDISELIRRGYWLEEKLVKNSILFVGLNPSYDNYDYGINYYNLTQEDNKAKHYNGKFEKISKEIDHHWTHHDLFFFRNTKQDYFEGTLWKTEEGRNFLDEQVKLSMKIIEVACPKIIVVTNALARQYFDWFLKDYTFSEDIGTYVINREGSSLNQVPIFFSGMLSGQRALDLGSFERLAWHIRQLIKGTLK